MSWRERLRGASFREAPFLYESAELAGGRRIASHVYPLRDTPFQEDLGARRQAFTLNALVIGEDYMARRDRLLGALNAPGPGTLVHPYLGAIEAVCLTYRLVETTRAGRMARFTISFEQAGAQAFPAAVEDTAAAVEAASVSAKLSIETGFAESFTVAGKPRYVLTAATGLLGDMADLLDGVAALAPADPLDLAGFAKSAAGFKSELNALVQTPTPLAGEVTGLIGRLGGLFGDAAGSAAAASSAALAIDRSGAASAGLVALSKDNAGAAAVASLVALSSFGDDLPKVPAGTVGGAAEAANQTAIVGLVRQAAVVEAARTSAGLLAR